MCFHATFNRVFGLPGGCRGTTGKLKVILDAQNQMNQLLCKDVKWQWNKACNSAFESLKTQLAFQSVLVHYDVNLPVKLACDASSYGLGVVISHVMPDHSKRPIAYASRSLSKAEKNYSQIEKGLILG